jgi:23S rRNA-/tRNA-specific pseudouridylate synthase
MVPGPVETDLAMPGPDCSGCAGRCTMFSSRSLPQRVDNYLMAQLKGVPRSLVYKLLRRGEVRVNKGRVKPHQRLALGDDVRMPPVRTGTEATRPRPPAA